ncbi:hypothetical protein QBC36DRAFT_345170 [Triangularia setosa]|uniref:Uncharacterized protein n=1 Tax=Triangularia setosa TaxID=2587417 RepID=A0AAN6W9M3_9PEZI|nr:hypothetical protein QBC36DRAFT_345170 [Podospora setosa]
MAMAQDLILPCSFDFEKDHDGEISDDDDDDDDDDDHNRDPRLQKRRKAGRPITTTRQRRSCLRGTVTTSIPHGSQSRTKTSTPKRIPSPRHCSTMSLCPSAPPPPSSPSQPPGPPKSLRALLPPNGTGLSGSAVLRKLSPTKGGAPRPQSLRKLLPKIGCDLAMCETRNRYTRKVARRLAGLEGREGRAILRALDSCFSKDGTGSGDGRSGKSGKGLDKKGVERGLVEVLERGLGLLRSGDMKIRGLEDQSLFWGSVVRAGGCKLVKVANGFIAWLEENEDGRVKKGYFEGIEGAVHVGFLGGKGDKEAKDTMLEMLRAKYVAKDMDIYVDFDEQLTEELGDLMARLAIDADEEMVDVVDWEDWEWRWGEEGADEGIL